MLENEIGFSTVWGRVFKPRQFGVAFFAKPDPRVIEIVCPAALLAVPFQ
jgi:hypothetical protein